MGLLSSPFNGGTITRALNIATAAGTLELDPDGLFLTLADGSHIYLDPSSGGNAIIHQTAGGVVARLGAGSVAVDGDVVSSGNALINGYVQTDQNTAPADGNLSQGQAAIWFDKTNGAAKLMVKAKQADGTVKTGSVNLA